MESGLVSRSPTGVEIERTPSRVVISNESASANEIVSLSASDHDSLCAFYQDRKNGRQSQEAGDNESEVESASESMQLLEVW